MKFAGVTYALVAYSAWGIMPIYWKQLGAVPSEEVLAHRFFWASVFCALLLTMLRRWPEVGASLRRGGEPRALFGGALLLAVNWLIFLFAVNSNQLVAVSFGYYLNPLLTVLLAALLLHERLGRLQLIALAIAALGLLALVIEHGTLPWISLSLALTFGLYSLAHKFTQVRPVPRLWMETTSLIPCSLLLLWSFSETPFGPMDDSVSVKTRLLLLGAGPATALPMLCFAAAARRLSLSALGICQYFTPTLIMLVAVFIYDEPLGGVQLFAFSCTWVALALFSAGALWAERKLRLAHAGEVSLR